MVMKLTRHYWIRQAGIGLLVVGVLALLGHFNYAQFRLTPGFSLADWYFLASWLCFPFAKWAILEDNRQVSAPTVPHRKKRRERAAEQTASVYEKAHKRATNRAQAAPKTPLKWYWLIGVDILLAFVAPLIFAGFITYSLRHN